ncbi:S41 family peptidase [Bacillus carboniphilus]|uniref:S41 family peptidase n=1 Tax=Bacillus carboniphilus TaxID=86663 RepID=A0ABP3G9K8_9BACI
MLSKWRIIIAALIIIAISLTSYTLINSKNKTEEAVGSNLTEEQITNNIKAFAKLYGYIRYFHPSDEAAELDWDGFAMYGVEQVKNSRDTEELKQNLERLFIPIAPTLTLTTDKNFNKNDTEIEKLLNDETNSQFIFWQHKGVQTNFTSDIYGSTNEIYGSKKVIFTEENGQINLEEPLFEGHLDKENYVIEKDLTKDIKSIIPVVLPFEPGEGSKGSTSESKEAFEALQDGVYNTRVDGLFTNKEDARISGVVITWNVYQHFYPYLDEVDVNWEEKLPQFINSVKGEQNYKEYVSSLELLVENAQDGHSMVASRLDRNPSSLPFRVQLINDEIVITEVLEDSLFEVGDVIVKKDGEDANKIIAELINQTSGSPQYKEAFGEIKFVRGKLGTKANFEVLRQGEMVEVSSSYGQPIENLTLKETDPIYEIKDGIYYISLHRNITEKELEEKYHDLVSAKGLIFDGRYYPAASALQYLQHLTDEPVPTSKFRIPQYLLPDQQGEITYFEGTWELDAKTPKFEGEIVFLSDGSTMSYGETVLGFVENHNLGTIVGQSSAGANGNINGVGLMEGILIYFTGMKVLKDDESQHHIIGIQPDITVDYTLEAVKNGKDDFIEKAIEVIEKNTN